MGGLSIPVVQSFKSHWGDTFKPMYPIEFDCGPEGEGPSTIWIFINEVLYINCHVFFSTV